MWPNAADPVAQRSRLACDTVATWLWNLVRIVPATALLCAASTPWAVAMVPRLWSMAESTPLAAPAVSAAPRTVRWHGCGRKCSLRNRDSKESFVALLGLLAFPLLMDAATVAALTVVAVVAALATLVGVAGVAAVALALAVAAPAVALLVEVEVAVAVGGVVLGVVAEVPSAAADAAALVTSAAAAVDAVEAVALAYTAYPAACVRW